MWEYMMRIRMGLWAHGQWAWAHGAVGALAVGLADLAIISNLSNHGVAACFGVRTTTTIIAGKKRASIQETGIPKPKRTKSR